MFLLHFGALKFMGIFIAFAIAHSFISLVGALRICSGTSRLPVSRIVFFIDPTAIYRALDLGAMARCHHRLGQIYLAFRHAVEMAGLLGGHGHQKRMRIRHADILGSKSD